MIKRVALGTLALATALAIAPSARADTVTGMVAMAGLNTYTGSSITFTGPGHVFLATGSLAALLPDPLVNLNSFNFAAAPGTLLFDWHPGGPIEITMTILTFTVVSDSAQFLNTHGTAVITETGLSPFDYGFTLTSTVAGLTSFALDASPVPEPGSLFLVGTGLLVLAGLLLRKARKPASSISLPSICIQ